jgi:hypothetical protein
MMMDKLIELEARITPGWSAPFKLPFKTAANCFRCEHTFEPDDIVWRARVRRGRHGWTVAPLCDRCRPEPRRWEWWRWARQPLPCETCGRRVMQRTPLRYHTFCSPRCASRYHTARERAVRQQRPILDKVCDGCNGSFRATRADTAYCTSACRQRAYRLRRQKDGAS